MQPSCLKPSTMLQPYFLQFSTPEGFTSYILGITIASQRREENNLQKVEWYPRDLSAKYLWLLFTALSQNQPNIPSVIYSASWTTILLDGARSLKSVSGNICTTALNQFQAWLNATDQGTLKQLILWTDYRIIDRILSSAIDHEILWGGVSYDS